MASTSENLEEFFGVPLPQVNPLILRIALLSTPTWLKGIISLRELPRFETVLENYHVIGAITPWSTNDIAERIQWIVEEQQFPWGLDHRGFHFENLSEAVFFKLRWF